MNMSLDRRLSVSLLLLRVGIAIVMVIWAVDKFVQPEHAQAVYQHFYFLPGFEHTVFYLIGGVQLLVIAGFLAGVARKWTYGIVMVTHAVSTFSSWRQYFDPFEGANLLFFAAWPMLAACVALFLLREHDTLWTIRRA